MEKEKARRLTDQIVKTYKEEGSSYKIINEGVFTIESLWGDIVNLAEHRDLNLEAIEKFLQSDEKLIKIFKEEIVKFVEKYVYESLEEWESDEREEGETLKPQYYG